MTDILDEDLEELITKQREKQQTCEHNYEARFISVTVGNVLGNCEHMSFAGGCLTCKVCNHSKLTDYVSEAIRRAEEELVRPSKLTLWQRLAFWAHA